jgi:RND family efflux transporter MFP subunit
MRSGGAEAMAGEPTRPPNIRELESLRIARSDSPKHRGRLLPVLIGVAVLAALSAAGYFAWSKTLGRPPEVQTAIVIIRRAGQPGVLLTGSGYIVTKQKYITIGTKILGQIVAEPIQEGQHIRKGDLLARIDDRDYLAQLHQAEADRQLALANVKLKRAQAGRQRTLYQNGVTSRDEFDVAENSLSVAEAALARADAAIDYAKFNVSQCIITSPINGIVLKKYREVGDTINYGGDIEAGGGTTDIVQLADTDDMRAEVDINESDISKVSIGEPASVVLDAFPDRAFAATVVKIYPAADRQKGTVKVEVHIVKPDLRIIKPEMSTKLTFLAKTALQESAPLVLVPKKAVVTDSGRSFVWVVRADRIYRTNVSLGREFQDGIEVLQGLTGGEMVIVVPPAGLRDGEQVTPTAT